MSPNCHDIRWDTYCFSNVTVSPQSLCLFSLSDTRISRNASGELISAARLILGASAQERLNFGMVAGKPNLSNTVGKRMTYRISYEDGLAASADFEGGSPEEVCTTKEIRGAEVIVLSMSGKAGPRQVLWPFLAARARAYPAMRYSPGDSSKPDISKATTRKWRLNRSCPGDRRSRRRRADGPTRVPVQLPGTGCQTRPPRHGPRGTPYRGLSASIYLPPCNRSRLLLTHSRAELADQLRPAVQQRKYLAFLGRRQTDVHSGDAKVAVAFQQIQVFRSAAQRH